MEGYGGLSVSIYLSHAFCAVVFALTIFCPKDGIADCLDDNSHNASCMGKRNAMTSNAVNRQFPLKRSKELKKRDPAEEAVLPQKRIVAYYGTPASHRMGVLGEYQKTEMLQRLNAEADQWRKADPIVPVQPALHVIGSVAQKTPGASGRYRQVLSDAKLNQVYEWAKGSGALLFIDIQTGHENIRSLLPRFESLLKKPDVHLGIDPEFNLAGSKVRPGMRVGSYDAKDINFVSRYLQELVRRYNLPPKVLVVHRFTRSGVTKSSKIILRPEVQIVMNMDGWGSPGAKRKTYRKFISEEPVQYTGFKLFYRNDARRGGRLMEPREVLALNPRPLYIQYQ